MSVGYNLQEENQADTALSAHQSDSRNNPITHSTCPTDLPFGLSEIWVLFYFSKTLTGTASKSNIKVIKYLMHSVSKVQYYHWNQTG